jgi:hypothetical protein
MRDSTGRCQLAVPRTFKSFWQSVHLNIHPYVPNSTEQLVTIVFVHSLLLTIGTPIFRILYGRWGTEVFLYAVLQLIAPAWVTEWSINAGLINSPGYMEYPAEGTPPLPGERPVKGIDLAFALHAGFGLAWLTVGFLQIALASKLSPKSHRTFGYLSFLVFLAHISASCYNLAVNVVRHGPLPRMMLLGSAFNALFFILRALRVAIKKPEGWRAAHSDLMLLCYFYSIQGAGPIRWIAQLQDTFDFGPVQCQIAHGGMATACMWPYCLRMFFITLHTLYVRGMHVRMRGEGKLKDDLLQDVHAICCGAIGFWLVSKVPHAEDFVALLLGTYDCGAKGTNGQSPTPGGAGQGRAGSGQRCAMGSRAAPSLPEGRVHGRTRGVVRLARVRLSLRDPQSVLATGHAERSRVGSPHCPCFYAEGEPMHTAERALRAGEVDRTAAQNHRIITRTLLNERSTPARASGEVGLVGSGWGIAPAHGRQRSSCCRSGGPGAASGSVPDVPMELRPRFGHRHGGQNSRGRGAELAARDGCS